LSLRAAEKDELLNYMCYVYERRRHGIANELISDGLVAKDQQTDQLN